MKAITIIEKMCYFGDCENFRVFHCYDEFCTNMPCLCGYFGLVHTQVGKLEVGDYLYLYMSTNEYEVEKLCNIEHPVVELHTKEGEDIYLWKIE